MKKPELLVPASSLEVLKIAFIFGADAVYIGGQSYGLRAKARNFSIEEIREGIEFAHNLNRKVYITVNIFAHPSDLSGVKDYLEELRDLKPDGLIIADAGIFTLAGKICPEIPRHISTQANNTNEEIFKFWFDLGATRVVSARELTLEELKTIRQNMPAELELETFVHGAMCISYSGRCLLSNYLVGRDANQGECTHPCRWKYSLVEEKRPNEYFPIDENERGTYIMNSKDLCMIEYIPELIETGIDSFKIEGRMKNALYVATVARTYRHAIDDYLESIDKYKANMDWYKEQISCCTNRSFSTGFFFGKPSEAAIVYDNNEYNKDYTYLGFVEEVNQDYFRLTQRNKFEVGESIEVMKPNGETISARVLEIKDENDNLINSAPHPKQTIWVKLENINPNKYDVIRIYREK